MSEDNIQVITDVTEETELDKHEKETWIQAQIDSHNIQREAATSSIKVNKEDTVKLTNILTELGEDLRKQQFDRDRKEVILKRIQLGNFLVNEIFEKDQEDGENGEKIMYIVELLEKQCRLVTDIMKELKKTSELKNKLDTLKKENSEKRIESRRLMLQIKEKNEAQQQIINDQETTQSIKEFDVIIQKIVIARHTLQGLVLGSGVNWADDPHLLQVVLKLGETLDFK